FLPAGTDDVAAHDGFHGHRLEALGNHRATYDQRQLFGRHHVLDPVAREVVGYQAGQLVEPEVGDGGEDLALLRNGFGQDHVERGQAIGRDHQHAFVVDFVEVADLARVDFLQAESVAGAH